MFIYQEAEYLNKARQELMKQTLSSPLDFTVSIFSPDIQTQNHLSREEDATEVTYISAGLVLPGDFDRVSSCC